MMSPAAIWLMIGLMPRGSWALTYLAAITVLFARDLSGG
jgi:hypothetical protein